MTLSRLLQNRQEILKSFRSPLWRIPKSMKESRLGRRQFSKNKSLRDQVFDRLRNEGNPATRRHHGQDGWNPLRFLNDSRGQPSSLTNLGELLPKCRGGSRGDHDPRLVGKVSPS